MGYVSPANVQKGECNEASLATVGSARTDQSGEEVDGGDFEEIDADTVAFPSHAEEFGQNGDILVDYTVNQDVVTFEVNMPSPCADTLCRCIRLDVVRVRLRALAAGGRCRVSAEDPRLVLARP
jgi:hypothetical protein